MKSWRDYFLITIKIRKTQIQAKQRAFAKCDKAKLKYKHLSRKVSSSVAKAKETYYKSEAELFVNAIQPSGTKNV